MRSLENGRLEKEVDGPFVTWLAANYPAYFAIKFMHRRGWPDRIVVGPERFVLFLEFKRPGAPKKRRGEKLQRWFADQLRSYGFTYEVVNSKATAIEAFRKEIRT